MSCRIILLFIFFSNLSFSQINPLNIDIVRGKYGTPHIFAKTDKETAYGLAWAHAEDDFKTIQQTFLPVKGALGKYLGKDGTVLDYVIQLLRCKETVDNHYNDLSPEVLRVIEGYVEGLNTYALFHPKEVLVKNTFPISIKDYLIGFNLVIHFFSDAGNVIKDLFTNKISAINDSTLNNIGSNGFAFRKSKTEEGKTYLNVNTHQPLEGPFAWYEAHMVSEEGWNMLGGLFPGSALPFIGTNENLGWTHTYNYPDLIDVFQLQMNPKNKNQYLLDNKWVDLERSKAKLKVKIKLGINIPIKKELLWSKYGPVIRNDSGVFSFHLNALENISAIDQWYHMNKSTNYDEFMEALNMMGIPRFNIIYADNKDNIYYVSNAQLPIRDTSFDWSNVVPGNTSKTIVNDYHKLNELPQLLNPSHGYLFNTNNSPFNCSHNDDNPIKENYSSTFSFREKFNNRSLRFEELIAEYDKVSYQDFIDIKYDQQYPKKIFCPFEVNDIFSYNSFDYPDLKELIDIIQSWDRKADLKNTAAAQWFIYYRTLNKSIRKNNQNLDAPVPRELIVNALSKTKDYFINNFGTLDVSLGDFQKHVRGDVELPISGLVDMIAATSTQNYKDGKVKAVSGDSYIMLVRYSKDDVEIETVLPYGISTHAGSPNYTDQMSMYANHQRKKMYLDKEIIMNNATRAYHPK